MIHHRRLPAGRHVTTAALPRPVIGGPIGYVAGLAIGKTCMVEIHIAPVRGVVALAALTRIMVGRRIDRMATGAIR